MSDREPVTFTLSNGAKVTAPREVARKLGWTEPQPEPKRATRSKTK